VKLRPRFCGQPTIAFLAFPQTLSQRLRHTSRKNSLVVSCSFQPIDRSTDNTSALLLYCLWPPLCLRANSVAQVAAARSHGLIKESSPTRFQRSVGPLLTLNSRRRKRHDNTHPNPVQPVQMLLEDRLFADAQPPRRQCWLLKRRGELSGAAMLLGRVSESGAASTVRTSRPSVLTGQQSVTTRDKSPGSTLGDRYASSALGSHMRRSTTRPTSTVAASSISNR